MKINQTRRIIIHILSILILVSCQQENRVNSKKSNKKSTTNKLKKDNYILSFENAKKFTSTDIYGDISYRNKLTDSIGNYQERAMRIQSYLNDRFGNYFSVKDNRLILKISNGKKMTFPLWDEEKEIGYNFVNYFANIDYYLLRIQFVEGNCWMMINRRNGFKKYISGLPYISKNNKNIITINCDLYAGYSFNGIELFSINKDSITTEFSKETSWGPTGLKWINKNKVFIKREFPHIDTISGEEKKIIDYKVLTFKKNR